MPKSIERFEQSTISHKLLLLVGMGNNFSLVVFFFFFLVDSLSIMLNVKFFKTLCNFMKMLLDKILTKQYFSLVVIWIEMWKFKSTLSWGLAL